MNVQERNATVFESGASVEHATEKLHPLLRCDVRAVLFDAGGTLVHPDWQRLVSLAAGELETPINDAEMRRAVRETLRDVDACVTRDGATPEYARRLNWVFRRTYGALGFDEPTCERILERAQESHGERHLWCELDPEAPRVLAALKQAGLRIAVISNTEDGRLEELLELVEIAHYFDLLIDSQVVGHRKPDAAIFHFALAQLGLKPEEAVYVGDLYGHDVLAAERAGMRAILFDPLGLHGDKACPRIATLIELVGQTHTTSPVS